MQIDDLHSESLSGYRWDVGLMASDAPSGALDRARL